MTRRIFTAVFATAIGIFAFTSILFTALFYQHFSSEQMQQLENETQLLALAIEDEQYEYLQKLEDPDVRVTWIAQDGTVLYDSREDESEMENHLSRRETSQALKTGSGQAIRQSSTILERCLYSARQLNDGTIVRLSSSVSNIYSLLLALLPGICLFLLIVLVISWMLAFRLSRRITEPLNAISLDPPSFAGPLSDSDYDEIAPLLLKINSQHKQIEKQKRDLNRKSQEFEAAVFSMEEGILLLDSKDHILQANPAAIRLLNMEDYWQSENILNYAVPELYELLSRCKAEGPVEKDITLHNEIWQIKAAPVLQDGKLQAITVLMLNITKKAEAENLRREFTSNVSHDLKTPLQSILSASELMKEGLVAQSDQNTFAATIHKQALRMQKLISDLMQLSSLEEQKQTEHLKPVRLDLQVKNMVEALQPEASMKDVTITANLEPCTILGSVSLTDKIAQNLLDNALKYNVEGGWISVRVYRKGSMGYLDIQDGGIGISQADQSRIFERFYRADKSRSSRISGTGLGMSIVKHAVSSLNGTITLQSEPGNGTLIQVCLPLDQN